MTAQSQTIRDVKATWWHRGWGEYALRLETHAGVFEAVEDNWFAATRTIHDQHPGHLDFPFPTEVKAAEDPQTHEAEWTTWLNS